MKFCQLLLLLLNVKHIMEATAVSEGLEEGKQCIGKHQIPLENLYDFEMANEIKEPVAIKNFDVLPMVTILENNDDTIVIKMTYNSSVVPTINFGTYSGLDTYRFEFLYFQKYESSATLLPLELHAVFSNTKIKNIQNALKGKNQVVVLSFGLEVQQSRTKKYAVLKKYLQSVRTGLTKNFIENLPLNIWLPALMKEYFLYEGSLPLVDCTAQVLWVDFATKISLEPELLKEFELLQTHAGQALMKQYKTFLAPSGPLIVNFGLYATGVGGSMGGIPLVDAYYDGDDGNTMAFNGGAFQRLKDVWNVAVLIIISAFYCVYF